MNILSHFPHLGTSKQPQNSDTLLFTYHFSPLPCGNKLFKFENLFSYRTSLSSIVNSSSYTRIVFSAIFTVLKELNTVTLRLLKLWVISADKFPGTFLLLN